MKTAQKTRRALIIDNIDSFVYNLAQYAGIQGADPIVVQNTESIERIDGIIDKERITHIIISPGPKRPEDAGVANEVIRKYGPKMPLLGVCLGHQCIGYVYGGTIRGAKTLMHGKTSLVQHDGDGIFKDTTNPLEVTRYHSLVIDDKTLPACLKETARSLDDNEIMGVKHVKYPIYGVQFHPESIKTKDGMKMIQNFLEEER